MKKNKESENPWIKHDGGACPIPWAKAGEYEAKFINELFGITTTIEASFWTWESAKTTRPITHFRLTNGWIYVPGDGTIPEAIRGAKGEEWELQLRDGRRVTPENGDPDYYSSMFSHLGTSTDIVAVRLVKEDEPRIKTSVPPPETINDRALCRGASIPMGFETEKQRLTREAWQRYKAKNPDPIPFTPMRENEQYEIAAVALAEHDLVWPVRKR